MGAQGKAAEEDAKFQASVMRESAKRLAGDASVQIQDYSTQASQALANIVAAYGAAGALERTPGPEVKTNVDTNVKPPEGVQEIIDAQPPGDDARYGQDLLYRARRIEEQQALMAKAAESDPVENPAQARLLSGSAGHGITRTRDLLERDRQKMISDVQTQVYDAYRGAAHAESMGDLMKKAANLNLVMSIVGTVASFAIPMLGGPAAAGAAAGAGAAAAGSN